MDIHCIHRDILGLSRDEGKAGLVTPEPAVPHLHLDPLLLHQELPIHVHGDVQIYLYVLVIN